MPGKRPFEHVGIGVSPGIAIGPAYVLEHPSAPVEGYDVPTERVEEEVRRFHTAVGMAIAELAELSRQVRERVDPQQAAIFEAHQAMLADPMLVDRTDARIRGDRLNAEYVLWSVTQEIGRQLADIGDEYFSERNHDLFDVSRRVLKFLRRLENPDRDLPREGAIVFATDLGPGETVELHHMGIAAFALGTGGPTGHTAILAKSLGLPAVVGVENIVQSVRSGMEVIVDGAAGLVIVQPPSDVVAQYRRLQERFLVKRMGLEALRELPAVTRDGHRVRIEANIEFPEEVEAALHHGAEGIGLYRTEFLYLRPDILPSEDESFHAYKQVLDRVAGPVTFRTLDLGGDKRPELLPSGAEGNPMLGLRALRLCLAQPRLFRVQLRSLIRAGEGRTLRIMLPMVSSVEEVEQARHLIEDVEAELVAYGHSPVKEMLIGAMVEVPSAAIIAPALAHVCDFFSIGTNDLTQYTLAVDRLSSTVAHLYQPAHPAVLRLIAQIVDAGRDAGIPVSVCGEMAGDPRLALLLLGMGVECFSMSPACLPEVKRAFRRASLEEWRAIAGEALRMSNARAVSELLRRALPEGEE